MSETCAGKGPLADLAIGACALLAKAELVTTDPHFKRIPGLKIRKDLPGANTIGAPATMVE